MEDKGLIFNGVTSDSRKVKDGYIFVAIKGEEKDGNDYIKDAEKNGATLIISEKNVETNNSHLQVKDARIALAKMNKLFYSLLKNEIKVIGVTGTNGKTTTTHMIEAIFNQADRGIALMGGQGFKMGTNSKKSMLTTPSSEEINEYLYNANQRGIKWAVMEVSSHGLKQRRVEGIDFDTAIFTNISSDHLDYHKSFEDYFNSKKIMFQGLKSNSRAIINGDDTWSLKMLEGLQNIYIITYGLKSKSTITASSIDITQGIKFNYCLQRSLDSYKQNKIDVQEFPIEINLLGYHNIYNALAAITTALIYEIPVDSIQKALKKFKPVSRRLEYSFISPYYVLDDYAHNPSSFEAAFQALQSIDYKNVHVLVGIRGNRGIKINQQNAEIIGNWCSLLEINDLYVTEYKESLDERSRVNPKEREIFLNTLIKKNISFKFSQTIEESIKQILLKAESKDLIMLLGGHGMDIGKEIVQKLIK